VAMGIGGGLKTEKKGLASPPLLDSGVREVRIDDRKKKKKLGVRPKKEREKNFG